MLPPGLGAGGGGMLVRLCPLIGSSPKDNSQLANVYLRVRVEKHDQARCSPSLHKALSLVPSPVIDKTLGPPQLRERELQDENGHQWYHWGRLSEPCRPPHMNQKTMPLAAAIFVWEFL